MIGFRGQRRRSWWRRAEVNARKVLASITKDKTGG